MKEREYNVLNFMEYCRRRSLRFIVTACVTNNIIQAEENKQSENKQSENKQLL